MRNAKITRVAAAGAVVGLAAAGAATAAARLHASHHSAAQGGQPVFVSGGTGTAPASGYRFGGGHFGGPRGDDLAVAATYLGITEDALATQLRAGKTLAQIANGTSGKSESGLVGALVAHEQDELAQAVKDGKLTQAQADQLSANLKDRITQQVERTGPPAGGPGFGHGHGPGGGDDLAAAASYLGISTSSLVTQLQSGKTLGQVADDTAGKSKAGLVDALVAHEQAELAQAVKDGKLTQAQADQAAAGLAARVTAQVNGTGFDHHGFDGPHGHGPGGPWPGSGSTPPPSPSAGTHI